MRALLIHVDVGEAYYCSGFSGASYAASNERYYGASESPSSLRNAFSIVTHALQWKSYADIFS
jgi:hypothetical protein